MGWFGWWDVDFEGVLRDSPFDAVRFHCLWCSCSSWTQLLLIAATLVDEYVFTHLELVVSSLAVGKPLYTSILVGERTVSEFPIST